VEPPDEGSSSASHVPHVALTWDGPWQTLFSRGLPLFRRHGLAGTIYVITGLAGKTRGSVPGDRYCTWAQDAAFARAGWEVSNHTVTHPDLTKLDEASVTAEVLGAKQDLVRRGYATPGFAYPYNKNDATARQVAATYQLYARAGIDEGPIVRIGTADQLFTLRSASMAHLSADELISETEQTCFGFGQDMIRLGHLVRDPAEDRPGQHMSVSAAALDGYLRWLADQQRRGLLRVTTCQALVLANLIAL